MSVSPPARAWRREAAWWLVALVAVAVAARLGFWQLDRAAQKVALQSALESRIDLPVLGAAELARSAAGAEAQHYRRVSVRGRWVANRTVFLDNRQMDDQVGFYVVTPLVLDGTQDVVLVQRGWVPRDFTQRERLPAVPSPDGVVGVEGIVAAPPSKLYELGHAASGAIRQNVDLGEFAGETSLALLPLSIQQRNKAGRGDPILRRHWALPATDVQKHYGYAFQWFAIAFGIAVLHVRQRTLRRRRR